MASILLIDDSKSTALAVRFELERAGHDVVAVEDGVKALEILLKKKVDLVILDLFMPVMNGWEFLDSKSGLAGIAPIPVIVYSAYSGIPQPFPAGQKITVIEKPQELSVVTKTVNHVLQGLSA